MRGGVRLLVPRYLTVIAKRMREGGGRRNARKKVKKGGGQGGLPPQEPLYVGRLNSWRPREQ